MGDRMETLGNPACISLGLQILPSTETFTFLSERRELISLIILVEHFNLCDLHNKSDSYVVSIAFSISKNTAVVQV